ncbi:MAG: sulfurtransferase [Bryobacterales bacterium]|nr:sulfurtransferase [Bryobacterales bacterium]
MDQTLPLEISPAHVKAMLSNGSSVRLIDVREPFEHQQARIDGGELIPMRSIPAALPQIEGIEDPIVVYCHHGVRSLQVVAWLREQGIEHCTSMEGGIDRWSLEVDPAVPRYF